MFALFACLIRGLVGSVCVFGRFSLFLRVIVVAPMCLYSSFCPLA